MASVPLEAVQELLGHANLEMTLRYTHQWPEARRPGVCALDRAPATLADRPALRLAQSPQSAPRPFPTACGPE